MLTLSHEGTGAALGGNCTHTPLRFRRGEATAARHHGNSAGYSPRHSRVIATPCVITQGVRGGSNGARRTREGSQGSAGVRACGLAAPGSARLRPLRDS